MNSPLFLPSCNDVNCLEIIYVWLHCVCMFARARASVCVCVGVYVSVSTYFNHCQTEFACGELYSIGPVHYIETVTCSNAKVDVSVAFAVGLTRHDRTFPTDSYLVGASHAASFYVS